MSEHMTPVMLTDSTGMAPEIIEAYVAWTKIFWKTVVGVINEYDGDTSVATIFDTENAGTLQFLYLKGAPRAQANWSLTGGTLTAWAGGHVKASILNYTWDNSWLKGVVDIGTVQTRAGTGVNTGNFGLTFALISSRFTHHGDFSLFGIEGTYELGFYGKVYNYRVPTSFTDFNSWSKVKQMLKDNLVPYDAGLVFRIQFD